MNFMKITRRFTEIGIYFSYIKSTLKQLHKVKSKLTVLLLDENDAQSARFREEFVAT